MKKCLATKFLQLAQKTTWIRSPNSSRKGFEEILAAAYLRSVSITSRNQRAWVSVRQYILGTSIKEVDGDMAPIDRTKAVLKALELNPDDISGEIDIFKCDECLSVHSLAAYYVELLDRLPEEARDHLFHRRPDLQHIELSCPYTNVAMPYIDLALETMENFAISSSQSLTDGLDLPAYNTSKEAETDELLAQPEQVKGAIYQLGSPFNKPSIPFESTGYDLGLHESRLLLKSPKLFSTTRHDLMEVFQDAGGLTTKDKQSVSDL